MNYAKSIVAAIATAAASFGSAVAVAQNAPGSSNTREEITVTARRTEERLQDVPIAVSAFSADEMAKRSMRELEDVALATPGFSFEDFGGGFGVPTIRGGSQLRIQDLDQTTSVYLDGVYLPRQYMFDFGTVGFDRIEVVKGPQSALYGRNAFLGAVNYVSSRAGDELGAEVTGTLGTDDLLEFSGEVSGPIVDDRFGGRAFFSYSEFDGTWNNEHPNAGLSYGKRGTEDNLGGWENTTFGFNLDASPIDRLGLEFDYYRVERFQEADKNIRVEAPGDTNCSPTLGGGNRFYCGELPDTFIPLAGGSPVGSETVIDPRSYNLDTETDFFRLGINYEFSDNWSAIYQYGYSDSEVTSAGPGDRDPLLGSIVAFVTPDRINLVNVTPAGTNEYDSHELRVEFNQGPWTAFVGLFTSEIDDFDKFDLGLAPLRGADPFVIDPIDGLDGVLKLGITNARTEVQTDAIFGRVGWASNDGRWNLSAEARYAEETKTLDSNTTVDTDVIFEDTWYSFTPRFTVDYRLNDDQMLYASVAKGEKSGGFNNTVLDESQRSFEPDENWTYEIGSKNELLDGRLRANAALYFTDWDDLQINSTPIGFTEGATVPAIVDNTGGAEIWGIELDGVWYALDNLLFDYAVSWVNSEYKSGSKSARIGLTGGCDDIVCPADGDIGGNQLQRQPEFQLSLGAEVNGVLTGNWEWSLRGDVTHQSKQYVDELNLAWVPDRTLVNARFQVQKDRLTASLWAKNLFDEEYVANAFFIATPFSTSYVPTFGDKMTAGLTISYAL